MVHAAWLCASLVFDIMPEAFLSLKDISVTTFNIRFEKRNRRKSVILAVSNETKFKLV